METIWRGNDNLLDIEGVTDTATGASVSDATVSCTVKDAATGNALAGATWPLAMNYVTGTNGVYRATLPYTLVTTPNQRLVAEITAIRGGTRAFLKVDAIAKDRR